jgi:hypothetical protein
MTILETGRRIGRALGNGFVAAAGAMAGGVLVASGKVSVAGRHDAVIGVALLGIVITVLCGEPRQAASPAASSAPSDPPPPAPQPAPAPAPPQPTSLAPTIRPN